MNAPVDRPLPQAGQGSPELESLLAFWRDAGLEVLVEDAPLDRTLPVDPPRQGLARTSRASPAPTGEVHTGPGLAARIAQAREAALAASDLEALARAIDGFDGCPLKTQGARRSVFARGRPDAPVMLVGEAPGAEEDQQGLPFVGRAGQLLDRMIAAAGLDDRVFITNTVFWRPPGNRTPTTEEQQVCAPFVHRALALVRPRLLVLVGGASAKFMLASDRGILSLRGQWQPFKAPEAEAAVPALPTLHPAFLLRQPAAKKAAWADWLEVSARLEADGEPA